jgi:hypothetical protein
MTLPSLLLALAVSAPSGAAGPPCSPPAPKDLGCPASFANDLLGSLGKALGGTQRVDTSRSQAASDLIPAVGLIQADFACAARFVAPYEKSKVEAIRAAAKNVAEKDRALAASLDGQLTWLRYVNGESSAGKEPDPARSEALLEKAVQQKNEASQAAAIAAIESLEVVVEFQDGKPTGLRLTQAERQKLESSILKKFGDGVRNGPAEDNDFATNAAAAWYQVLSNPEYRAASTPCAR